MLKGGVHPKIVSERLVHANIGITLDTYSHVVPGLQESAALRFDTLLESKVDQTEDVICNDNNIWGLRYVMRNYL